MHERLRSEKNPYLELMKEHSPLGDRLIAVALKAFSEGGIEHFKPKATPNPPAGYNEAHIKYLASSEKKKAETYEELVKAFYPYFKEKREIEAENYSNKKYLEEVLGLFEAKEMDVHAKRLKDVLKEFQYA